MKHKLVASDMDGTLLGSDSLLPEGNVQAVAYCTEKGVKFVLCTGRPVQAIMPHYRRLNLDTPIISYNGGRITDPVTGCVLYRKCLDDESVESILSLAREKDAVACVWADDKLYINKTTPISVRYAELAVTEPVAYDLENVSFKGKNVDKILWAHTAEETELLVAFIEGRCPDNVSCFTSTPEYIEFVNREVSKGEALKKLCEIMGIEVCESVAFGDGENDIELLKAAGLGVAMENAVEKVKKAADLITVSNDELGVAKVIYEVI
ncbi:MAG: HAD family hydrolase [Clostridia bacterium]|nr:HAD family hydrolase [Clostridia bacterium]